MAVARNINLLNKALDVLEVMASGKREMGVTEISRRANLVKSGTFRILSTLKERGYVYQNPINKSYGLGLKFYFIGSAVQNRLPLCRAARETLEPLSSRFNESFLLTIPNLQPDPIPSCVLLTVSGVSSDPRLSSAGSIFLSHASAAGCVLLAYLSKSELLAYKNCVLKAFTEHTITDWGDLERFLAKIRDDGYAACDSGFSPGVCDIAVPVFDSMHYPIASLAIWGSSDRIKALDKKTLLRAMKKSSAQIATKLLSRI